MSDDLGADLKKDIKAAHYLQLCINTLKQINEATATQSPDSSRINSALVALDMRNKARSMLIELAGHQLCPMPE